MFFRIWKLFIWSKIWELIKKNITYVDFKDTIKKNIENKKFSIIAEIKKASPSAGIIIKDYDPIKIANIYKSNKATCLSVLTEEDFFLGNLLHISKIKQDVNLPILCKDFFIDKFQIPLAKSYGADAILIILAGVSDKLADELYEEALKLNMSVIVEVHTVNEAKQALRFKDALIGINNRNLKTLKTDINTTYNIHDVLVNHPGPLISESGFNNDPNNTANKDKKSFTQAVKDYFSQKMSLAGILGTAIGYGLFGPLGGFIGGQIGGTYGDDDPSNNFGGVMMDAMRTDFNNTIDAVSYTHLTLPTSALV